MTSTFAGSRTLYQRRIAVTTKSLATSIGPTVLPVLWILVIAPALAKALGGFNPTVDYYTYLTVAQITFIVPFTAMFNGLNVIVDRQFGITRELIVAPISRSIVPLANGAGVTTITVFQTALVLGLAVLRGANFNVRWTTPGWLLAGVVLLTAAIYGIAEILALKINRQEAYGPLIAAVGVAPWFISGALFPLTALVTASQYVSRALPWTHAVAVFRYALMNERASGLENIWGFGGATQQGLMSLAYLAMFATLTMTLAARTFGRATQQD